jgi:hypothetical protein
LTTALIAIVLPRQIDNHTQKEINAASLKLLKDNFVIYFNTHDGALCNPSSALRDYFSFSVDMVCKMDSLHRLKLE